MDLVSRGKIDVEDVILRTQTDNFPFEATTVRMRKVRDKHPHVTLHIRGAKRMTKGWNGHAFEYAPTCRVNFGGSWQGKTNTAMDSNGDLDESLTWLDVHNVVERAKLAMGITNEKEKDSKEKNSTEEKVSAEKESGEEESGEEESNEEASGEEKKIPEWHPLKEIKAFEKRGWSS